MNKKGQFRIHWGGLDLVSAVIATLGVMAISNGDDTIGWILVILGVIKQFSGK